MISVKTLAHATPNVFQIENGEKMKHLIAQRLATTTKPPQKHSIDKTEKISFEQKAPVTVMSILVEFPSN